MTSSFKLPWYDVIVVGMGPAGASAAYELSHAGLSVLGLEKQTHPRYKVCGGALSARIDSILPPEYKEVVEESVHHLQFTYGPDQSHSIESKEPFAFMVMRARFDQWLMNRAQQSGTTVHEDEAVKTLQALPDGVEVTTTKGRYRSRVVIGADGAMSVVAQQLFPGRGLRNIPALESEICGVSEVQDLNQAEDD
jgi:flavin-dependent dehydrogenase